MTEPVKWVPVIKPGSAFDSRAEEVATEDAARDNPRREGEELSDWLARVNVAAGEILAARADARLPYRPDPEPVDWRDEAVDEIFGREPGEGGV